MLYKSVKIAEIKANVEKGIIEGYASHFDNKDSHGDIIQKGAFAKTIKEGSGRVKVLWQHNTYEPIGKPLAMSEDTKGLFTSSKISETDVGKKALILARDGVLNEMSIGYDTIKEDFDKKRNANLLKEIKLYEISAVTFASNPLANVTSVKDLEHLIGQYQYSGGNALDIIAKQLFEQFKTLQNEPTQITHKESIEEKKIRKELEAKDLIETQVQEEKELNAILKGMRNQNLLDSIKKLRK